MQDVIQIAEFSLAGVGSFTLALVLAKACLSGLLHQLEAGRHGR